MNTKLAVVLLALLLASCATQAPPPSTQAVAIPSTLTEETPWGMLSIATTTAAG